ncbi:helix-turn-helix domain-containing protein [Nocardia sp. CDC159]|uniref:Helix-turn-helix domain-containing protein n=1 Tax=Nocardia pulmonis TaxID=2951408 RepID=A0A9X2E5X5_9NOCA|nr:MULTISPECIES: helix-turn-helix domain-containing protein [Nocardia]MCM6774260.1 helix-turn-helix domain-containing protein [Nocardia pulmonis]MCM6787147.1 helix-turn-helix domain-containing protein [Nocardia sp. CDC159]
MHVVAALVPDRVEVYDLIVGCHVFATTVIPDIGFGYEVRVCGRATEAMSFGQRLFAMRAPWPLAEVERADTLVVPGFQPPWDSDPELVEAIRRAAAAGVRIASVCTGAFLLAEAGLLDGQRATTHWIQCAELARRYPDVRVDANVLFVDNGSVLTSAGYSAGLDMCLHMVRRDYGAQVAAETARTIVMPLQRDGGQSQFIAHTVDPSERTALQPVLEWIERHLDKPLSQTDIARAAGVSVRTLQRHFQEQLGTTALQWLLRARIDRARQLLESTDLSIEQIAEECGFGSAVTLRHHFGRKVGVAPLAYRKAFR